jgi:hypothetical protein
MRALFTIAVALVLIHATATLAMENEPVDFRGVPWGAEFGQYSKEMTVLRNEGDVVYYRRTGDVMKLNQVDALKVAYRFYKNRFSTGVIQTYGGANQKSLLEALKGMHGEPLRPRKRIHQYFWDGEIAYLVLTCEVTSYCVVEYASKPVIQQEQADTGVMPGAGTGKRDDN